MPANHARGRGRGAVLLHLDLLDEGVDALVVPGGDQQVRFEDISDTLIPFGILGKDVIVSIVCFIQYNM